MKNQPQEKIQMGDVKTLDKIQHIPPQMVLDYEIRASWWTPYCTHKWTAWIASTWFSFKLKRKYHRYIVHLDEQVQKQKAFYDKLVEQKERAEKVAADILKANQVQPGEAQ